MNKLPKEKRDRIIQIAVATGAVLAALWFFVINAQKKRLQEIADNVTAVEDKTRKADTRIKGAKARLPELEPLNQTLASLEKEMAPVNKREWIISIVSDFCKPYNVEYQRFSSEAPLDWEPLPKFPYKLVSLSVEFRAHYHAFGKFLAAFENRYPFLTAMNLIVEPSESSDDETKGSAGEAEKLRFRVDFVALSRSPTTPL